MTKSEKFLVQKINTDIVKLGGIFRRPQRNFYWNPSEAVIRSCSVKRSVLKNFTLFTGKHRFLQNF